MEQQPENNRQLPTSNGISPPNYHVVYPESLPELMPSRAEAIRLLFGSREDFASGCPGIFVFCHHLEKQFQELLTYRYDVIRKVLDIVDPLSIDHCWQWCLKVLEAILCSKNDDDSIEEARSTLISKAKENGHDISDEESLCILRAVFAILCWTSATLEPLITNESSMPPHSPKSEDEAPLLEAVNTGQTYAVYDAGDLGQALGRFFRSFRCSDWDTGSLMPQNEGSISSAASVKGDETLYESVLNYFSLSTIGGVEIKWVDTLTAHLAFDQRKRTLSIFRFPSFCVANALRHHDIKTSENIIAALLPPHHHTDVAEDPAAIHREILWSYHLLFGQSYKSRKLLEEQLSQGVGGVIDHAAFSIESGDPYLRMCASPISRSIFPPSALSPDNRIHESEAYSARDHFPVFGHRLRLLQDYNKSQQTSRFRGLWRDRRYPLQWYTFWAVIWIGGLGILISLLQLLVGFAQVYLAIRTRSE